MKLKVENTKIKAKLSYTVLSDPSRLIINTVCIHYVVVTEVKK